MKISNFSDMNKFLQESGSKFRFDENQEYSGTKKYYWGTCFDHGKVKAGWNNLREGYNPGCCHGKQVTGLNSMWSTRPDLRHLFIDDTPKNITHGSRKIIETRCPECHSVRKIKANSLTSQGFSCKMCSDGLSLPEKYARNLFKSLSIDFIVEYSPIWADGKKYDFYIPNLNMIVETHGKQHYKQTGGYFGEDSFQFENDNVKRTNAVKNNVRFYIEIDCSESKSDYMKYNFIESLCEHFDLSNIDWDDIFSSSQKSIVVKCWSMWESGIKSTKLISDELYVAQATVIRWLKIGSKSSKCDYNKTYCLKEHGKKSRKKIIKCDNDGNIIKIYESITSAGLENNINPSNISACLHGKTKSSGGFVWKFA